MNNRNTPAFLCLDSNSRKWYSKKMNECLKCGDCCRVEICGMGLEICPDLKPPCPFLTDNNLCGAIVKAESVNQGFASDLKLRLGIGRGCTNSEKIF